MNTQDFAGLVQASRSYRRFDESRALTKDDLMKLIELVRFAPTGNNTQLLRYHLTTDPTECKKVFKHFQWAGLLPEWAGPNPGERPTAYITICTKSGLENQAIRNLDAGIAGQTLMLAACLQGISGCMIKSFDRELTAELALDAKNLTPLLLLALGYKAADETVVLEKVDAMHGTRYWRDIDANCHHVPKYAAAELVV